MQGAHSVALNNSGRHLWTRAPREHSRHEGPPPATRRRVGLQQAKGNTQKPAPQPCGRGEAGQRNQDHPLRRAARLWGRQPPGKQSAAAQAQGVSRPVSQAARAAQERQDVQDLLGKQDQVVNYTQRSANDVVMFILSSSSSSSSRIASTSTKVGAPLGNSSGPVPVQ